MAVTAADLIDPTGRILPSLFPGDDSTALTARVNGYLDQALSQSGVSDLATAEQDAAVTQWAYWRAFDAVCNRLNADAARVDFDGQGGRQMLAEQFRHWAAQRDEARASYDAILSAAAVVDASEIPAGAPLPSFTTTLYFGF